MVSAVAFWPMARRQCTMTRGFLLQEDARDFEWTLDPDMARPTLLRRFQTKGAWLARGNCDIVRALI
jgi:hypothetical protein